ncbi:uncharacterized protein LOC115443595 [Manduca sexta]
MLSKLFVLLKFVEFIYADTLSDTAAFLASSTYKLQYVTSVVWSSRRSEDATDFLKRFHGCVVTNEIHNNNNLTTRLLNKAVGYKQTVLFVDSVEEFAYFINSVNLDLVIPIQLVLVLTTFVEDLSGVTRTAWQNDVADIIIVNQNFDGDISLTTFFPYGKGICGDYSPVVLKIDAEAFFPNKFDNFYGCPIRTALMNFAPYLKVDMKNGTLNSIVGIDGRIFLYVMEALNATIDVVSIEDHDGMGSFINGTPKGCFGDLVNKEADIIAPAAVMNYERYSRAQISHVYDTLDVHWCAPSRRIIFTWAKVLLPLLDYITIYMFITFAVFVTVTAMATRYGMRRVRIKDSIIFQTYVILIGQIQKFETESYIVNYLFVLWLWFCIVFRIAYQGDLIQGMHRTIQEPALGTLENALKYVDGYGGLEVFYNYYRDTPLAANFQILEVHDIGPYIEAIAAGKKFLILTDILLVQEFDVKIQILDEPVSRAVTCIFMRPGWPAAKEVDLLMQYIIEVGLTEKALKDYNYEWKRTRELRKEEYVHQSLDFLTLSACFYGLVLMWMISSIIFIIEKTYYDDIKQKQSNDRSSRF